MGGGGLQILGHKSWNVYGGKNREKVRQDEEKAREQEAKLEKKRQQADGERRLNLLRAKARERRGEVVEESADEQEKEASQVEKELEWRKGGPDRSILGELKEFSEKPGDGKNKKDESFKEKKDREKKEKERQKVQSADTFENFVEKPWYAFDPVPYDERFESKAKGVGFQNYKPDAGSSSRKRVKLDSALELEDPMKNFVHNKPSHPEQGSEPTEPPKKKEKKSKSIEELRMARMAREKAESEKANRLLNPRAYLSKQEEVRRERALPYNSTFNPTFNKRVRF
ncbi:hypothetical protein HDU96_007030 [Phlyctochytrium bullatum]|nr:hypothetical protein HDU96_007030 [Phlyctochytrium bullatum]